MPISLVPLRFKHFPFFMILQTSWMEICRSHSSALSHVAADFFKRLASSFTLIEEAASYWAPAYNYLPSAGGQCLYENPYFNESSGMNSLGIITMVFSGSYYWLRGSEPIKFWGGHWDLVNWAMNVAGMDANTGPMALQSRVRGLWDDTFPCWKTHPSQNPSPL